MGIYDLLALRWNKLFVLLTFSRAATEQLVRRLSPHHGQVLRLSAVVLLFGRNSTDSRKIKGQSRIVISVL